MNRPITLSDLNNRAKFRFAEQRDVVELVDLYQRFYREAVYKDYLEMDPTRVHETIEDGIIADVRPHIVAIVDDAIAGFVSYWFDHTFSFKPCQVMLELYVVPEYRRGALGRTLVGLMILEGQRLGAGAIHAPVASGMTEQRTLFNLFSKAGFKQFGFMLRRPL